MTVSRYCTILSTTVYFAFCIPDGRAQEAPSISPNEKQEVLVEETGATNVTLTASGGSTQPPGDNEGCPPWSLETTRTIWVYSGLNGTPVSGTPSDSSTLEVDTTTGGKANIKAKKEDEYKDSKGTTQKVVTAESSSVEVVSQVPTSLEFNSSGISGSGGSFTFTVKDQYGNSIKDKPLTLLESWDKHPLTYSITPGGPRTTWDEMPKITDAEAASGTDESGKIVDEPVTVAELSELEGIAAEVYQSSNPQFKVKEFHRKFIHKYKIKYGNTTTGQLFQHEQDIVIEIEWDSNNNPKAKVKSVSP